MPTLFINIQELLQVRTEPIDYVSGKDMAELPTIKNAFLLVEDGKIADFGVWNAAAEEKFRLQSSNVFKDSNAATHRATTPSSDATTPNEELTLVDCQGKMILPTWCDSHTHLVYAGNREGEFVDRIKGLTYAEIAEKGGGILNSAKQLQAISAAELYEQSARRLEEVIRMGTGAIEIKSGYGLTKDAELKMLRVIRRLRKNYPLPIKATFLGAHAIPAEYKGDKDGYLDFLINDVLPAVAAEKLADYVDIFCEKGYFSVADLERMLAAGAKYGLPGKVHVNQFTALGGIAATLKYKTLSVDHLEVLTDADITALAQSPATIPVALPGCSFFLSIPYTPGRQLIDAGLSLALATDYNPGSSPSGNMNFVVAAACIKMRLTPEEAINAATLNGAYAMGLQTEVGSVTVGKRANFILTRALPSYAAIPYGFGQNFVEEVWLDGRKQTS